MDLLQKQRLQAILSHILPSNSSDVCSNQPTSGPEQSLPGPWQTSDEKYGSTEIVNEYFLAGKPHVLLKKWRDEFGPIFGFYYYDAPRKRKVLRVVLSDPAECRRILKINPPKTRAYEDSIILGEGVLSTTDLKEWDRQRTLIKPVFSTESLKSLLPIMKQACGELMQLLSEASKSKKTIDIHEILSEHTFSIIAQSALGEESEFIKRRAKKLREAFNIATLRESSRSDIQHDKDYIQARAEILDFTRETILRYENQSTKGECPFKNHGSLISTIMKKDENGKPFLTPKQQSDELSTFMFAGHETTAHTLSWTIFELSRNPHYQRELQAEIDSKLKEFGSLKDLTYAQLFKFQFLTLVINETLRLWPVVATGTIRRIPTPTQMCGTTIPSGSVVFFSHYNIHREPTYWGNDCNVFNPRRKWVEEAFIPFTVSPRDCLGRNLAMLEMRITLIHLYSNFNTILQEPNKEFVGFNDATLHPEGGLLINLESRNLQ